MVVSDLHGTPAAFEAILHHARFDRARDRLVVAGDLVDGNEDSERCIEIAQEMGATILFGNHDIGHMIGRPAYGRPIDRQTNSEFLLSKALTGEWKLAIAIDGVIVVHAGFSEDYAHEFANDAGGDVERFVEQQNARFLTQIQLFAVTRDRGGMSIWDDESPVWFRPGWRNPVNGLPVTQMVGHTSPSLYLFDPDDVQALEESGFYMIDSDSMFFAEPGARLRYGVIENGQPNVVEFSPEESEE